MTIVSFAKANQLRHKSPDIRRRFERPEAIGCIMTSTFFARFPIPRLKRHPRTLFLIAAAALLLAPALVGCGKGSNTSGSKESSSLSNLPPDPNDPVVAKVNGVEIRQSDLAIAEEDFGPNPPALTPDAKREYIITYLSDIILVAKAAEDKKLADAVEFQRRVRFTRNKLLAESMLQAETKAAVTDESMRKVYDDAIKGMADVQEVRARHILIRVPDANDEKASKQAEEKIKAIIERLNKGEDFATLANELTEDPSGKQNGGDLDYFTKEQMVPEFSNVAFQLEKGQISGPIKTQFGWHVLKVEDKRMRQPPEFDKVKDQVRTIVMRKAQADFITKLRADAKIERMDKPAEPK